MNVAPLLLLCAGVFHSAGLSEPPRRAAQGTPETRVDASTFDDIVAHVVPGEDELRWRSIPWRPSLSAGMRDGARLNRPVLLWAMNGHPLGST